MQGQVSSAPHSFLYQMLVLPPSDVEWPMIIYVALSRVLAICKIKQCEACGWDAIHKANLSAAIYKMSKTFLAIKQIPSIRL